MLNDNSLTKSKDDYGALEPSISGKIMEIHHKGHHNVYVTGYNTNIEKLQEAQAKNDIAAQIALKPLINFHGGGHVNHSLFWENLSPKSAGGGEPPSGVLGKAIDETYGSFGEFQNKFNTALAAIQGSGWAWLVKDKETGQISIKTYAVSSLISLHESEDIIDWVNRTRILSLANTPLFSASMPGSTLTSKFSPFLNLSKKNSETN